MAANLYGHSFAMATERALATSMANLKSSAARKEKKRKEKKTQKNCDKKLLGGREIPVP
jgi:hypothetical protein